MAIGNMDSTNPKKGEPITGTVTIKIFKDATADTATLQGNAKITGPNQDKGPTLTIKYKDTNQEDKCITITLTSTDITKAADGTTVDYGHIFTEGFDTSKVHPEIISPTLMVIVGIAKAWSPQHNLGGSWGLWTQYEKPDWEGGGTVYAYLWHFFDLLMIDGKFRFKVDAGTGFPDPYDPDSGTARDIDTHKSEIQKGTGTNYVHLADEKYFTKFWHLLPSDMYILGNIMEQVYNHTQDDPSYHATGLTMYAKELESKAQTLQQTATSQSTTELANTRDYDIQGNTTPGGGLKEKAGQLRDKAQELYTQADQLETAATGPLADLRAPATALKTAAKSENGDDGLHHAAGQLASHEDGSDGLDALADAVIKKFEAVQGAYDELSKNPAFTANKTNQKVTAVENAYNNLKIIYDWMLNFTKLIKKASTLKSTAGTQSDSTELQATLSAPATTLATLAGLLSTAAGQVDDGTLSTQAGLLATSASKTDSGVDETSLYAKATALQKAPTNYTNATAVIQAFDTLKGHFDELIKLAIQHDKLEKVQSVQNAYVNLKKHYDTMMNFTKIRYYSEQISIQATTLRKGSGDDADNIVKYFESMKHAYSKVTDSDKPKVKAQFEALKDAYDLMLNNVDSQENAAKVLKAKTGKSDKEEGKLRKLAKTLYEKAEALETAAPAGADSNEALKLKAGTTENDGLRKLAKTLYEAAKALSEAMGDDDDDGKEEAQDLADAVGENESSGIRAALKDLHEKGSGANLPTLTKAVRDAYKDTSGEGVEKKFQAIQGQEDIAYASYKSEYQAVEAAWKAFDDLYQANLKQPATDLVTAIGGTDENGKLQKALQELGNLQDTASGSLLTGPVSAVKTAYDNSGRGVKPKFTTLKAKESSYKAIASIRPKYDNVVNSMNAFDNVYRPEELLMDAVGATDGSPTPPGSDPKTLREALYQLGTDKGEDPEKLSELAKDVKKQYGDNWGNDVKGKFHLVQAQADAYAVGSKTGEYAQLLEAWTAFNDMYYGVVSYYKYYIIIIPSIFTVLWTLAYWEGEKAMDKFPPPDDNQRDCKILNVESTPSGTATELTYSIDQNFGPDSHATSCGHKKSVGYYPHFIPPSLMVLVGMGLPLPNLTIVTAVSSFVVIMELLGIVLDLCKSNIGESSTTGLETKTTGF
ncbi:Theileria-specific hypothetical protein, putative [Theileria annulata]|uniref:Uncharacterized protein n=1 Tax=Theileria annulata TaxID=5874 RepID=Q4UAX7_THEAN|nr:Theileria-specific hypothetical protein, putative [Theileria annulata]CAI76024.1 Theileria-specific hypothetical protein, putative [Theileria annulata]|eukprot:XP_955500.1 Theileria-specific hypothetical protein, putative [Theileria annulata]